MADIMACVEERQNDAQSPDLLCDGIVAIGMAGQASILEAQLKAGIPLSYHDAHGNLVQKNPDGSIRLLKQKKDVK